MIDSINEIINKIQKYMSQEDNKEKSITKLIEKNIQKKEKNSIYKKLEKRNGCNNNKCGKKKCVKILNCKKIDKLFIEKNKISNKIFLEKNKRYKLEIKMKKMKK